ncbi:MAG: hypothetical protein WCS71_05310 [Sphaerochaetaceae bacterium]
MTMDTEYTAKLVCTNDGYVDPNGDWAYRDIVGIYRGDVEVDLVAVESSEDPEGYDDAVAKAIGSHDFKWIY